MSIDDGWDSLPRLRERLMQVAEERDRLQAQLDAERQGALAREQAVETAWAVARAVLAEGAGGRLTPRRAARWRSKHAELREVEVAAVCCRPGCRAPAEETGADGVTHYCRRHWQEAVHEGEA